MNRPIITTLLFALVAFSVSAGGAGEEALGSEERPIVWAFVAPPDYPGFAEDVRQAIVPVELSAGYTMTVQLFDTYAEIIERLDRGAVHMAALPSLTYVVASQRGTAEAGLIAEQEPRTFDAEIVARAELEIAGPGSIVGLTYARHDPYSSVDWLAPQIMMAAAGIDPAADIAVLDVASEQEVLNAIYEGRADLGVARIDALDRYAESRPDLKRRVTSLVLIESIGADGVHFHPSVDEAIRKAVVASLEEMSEDAMKPFTRAYGWTRFLRADDSDFDAYRVLLRSVGLLDLP